MACSGHTFAHTHTNTHIYPITTFSSSTPVGPLLIFQGSPTTPGSPSSLKVTTDNHLHLPVSALVSMHFAGLGLVGDGGGALRQPGASFSGSWKLERTEGPLHWGCVKRRLLSRPGKDFG